ncbi:MAG TPA: M28 family peptidase [Sphaerochaeta sp.]|nr:M28 family peptidase [Sphaerochaeta sp.]
MRYSLFRKRKKAPPLVAGTKADPARGIERLQAGRLASLALSLTAELVEQLGPRPSGSEASQLTAEVLAEHFTPFCDETEVTSTPISYTFHTLPLRMLVILYPVLLLLLLGNLAPVSLALFLLFGAWVYYTRYSYRTLARPLEKQGEGANVHGVINPAGEVEHTLIFSAHHDSAPLYRYQRLHRAAYLKKVGLPIVLFSLVGLLSIVQLVTARTFGFGVLLLLLLLLTPLVVPLWNFYDTKVSPGAGDNLNSASMLVQLARYWRWKRERGEPLQRTRLIFVSFDGEELGLQGSRHWYSEHTELTEKAVVLNFDAIYYADSLTFLERDANATLSLDTELARRCVAISHAMGYPAISESIPRLGGASDAASASRAGLSATTLTAVGWGEGTKASVWHTEKDTVDAIEEQAVERSLSVAIRLAEEIDAKEKQQEPLLEEVVTKEEKEHTGLRFGRLTPR